MQVKWIVVKQIIQIVSAEQAIEVRENAFKSE
jgi:hypothetical protein